MMDQPLLHSPRLLLRPFTLDDAKRVQMLAGDKRIADMTAALPHPYLDGMAEEWIGGHIAAWNARISVSYAIVLRQTQSLIGAISYVAMRDDEAEFGYWIGVPYWGCGYCTEAVATLIDFGFNTLGLAMQHARHLPDNTASSRVIIKNSLHYIGDVTMSLRGHNRVLKHYELSAQQFFAKRP